MVRAKLAPSLEAKPATPPSEPAILDQYEFLIEQTLLAGRFQEAFDLYWYGLGSYRNLCRELGESTRGLRIVERFVPQDNFLLIESHLSLRDRSSLVNALGLFATNQGALARAQAAFSYCRRLNADASDRKSESASARNLAETELHAGHFRQALDYLDSAVSLAQEFETEYEIREFLASRATAHFILGNIAAAVADFQRATELEGQFLHSLRGLREAECKLLRGSRQAALSQTQANRELVARYKWESDLCRCNALLTRLLLPDDPAQAAQHLQDARAFANRSGEVGLQLSCFHSACELHRHLNDLRQSITEAEAGILLADTCGFGWFSIDLRLALAETFLAAGDPHKALQNARNALDRSEAPDCQYAWGKADGLHFCGVAHLRLGEHELARQRLTAALEIREHLGHGRIEETRRALEQCRPKQCAYIQV
jgi:tetratricopeptide (TPR) repeat protein